MYRRGSPAHRARRRVKHHHTVVVAVRDGDPPRAVHRHALRVLELARPAARPAPERVHHRARRRVAHHHARLAAAARAAEPGV